MTTAAGPPPPTLPAPLSRLPAPLRRGALRALGRVAGRVGPTAAGDRFVAVQAATRVHQREHGCTAFTYGDGLLPGVLAAALAPARVVEVGTALGYLTLWLADATPATRVDTIETDPDHVRLAENTFQTHGVADRVIVHPGRAQDVLPGFAVGGYDLAVFDGFTPDPAILDQLHGLLRPGGLLLMANIGHPGTAPVRYTLTATDGWLATIEGDLAVAVAQPRSAGTPDRTRRQPSPQ